ncbi:6-phospho-alpha-glucosidase [Clostridium tertium]|jgi:maltose-6'-phosphate glucosidase|uniref:6-phospho-alpha-glucosidase n=1 Tax=Clostridium tertium TaxID=1559 RepID=A0A9X3XLM2_9CLOT|nr:6-phospho-alpha-glucosidase [Clostridium tertium]MBS6500089.1 6-phospho-alpha-glucosidase [Clostridium sp.]MBU6135540.1 6-phospho-alpha-glucosidase [Clostridium tertium]MDB1934637.1 6-phospho-alpha-glucosidase [Clostridium tertium]MDB1937884.1 6-phospho-alpha-glucosidase [Clostridium tertium]MDB1941434.1 6-phospho-alpha-glucosidase [Clostridium tertium]
MRSSNIITITGAGSARTPALVGSLVKLKDRFPLKKIIFYDIDNERTSKMEDYIRLVLKTYSNETEVVFTTDPDVAYEKTDFVFCQMRVGKNEMRSFDEKIPLKHGLVGQETCGPGGFAYGMRSLGAMVEMVNQVRKHSKDTWILNYTNPAAIVALGLDKVFPDDKRILNLCDQPYSLMRSYAKILGVEQKNLRATYFGLNHFGWFTELKDVDGNDYFDKLRTYLRDYDFKPYNAEQRSKSWLDTYLRVNKYMNFFDEYIPTTYLQYYFFAEEIVAESDPNYTRADEAKDSREKEVWDICSKATNANSIDDVEIITNSVFGDLMIELAESIAYDLHNEFILMSRNNDIITNFSKDAIVEVSGTVGKDGAHPYKYGEIKPFYKGLMEGQHAYELLTVEAFLEKNYTKALQALTLNRTIVNPEKAKAVLDDLMEKNKDFWYLT